MEIRMAEHVKFTYSESEHGPGWICEAIPSCTELGFLVNGIFFFYPCGIELGMREILDIADFIRGRMFFED